MTTSKFPNMIRTAADKSATDWEHAYATLEDIPASTTHPTPLMEEAATALTELGYKCKLRTIKRIRRIAYSFPLEARIIDAPFDIYSYVATMSRKTGLRTDLLPEQAEASQKMMIEMANYCRKHKLPLTRENIDIALGRPQTEWLPSAERVLKTFNKASSEAQAEVTKTIIKQRGASEPEAAGSAGSSAAAETTHAGAGADAGTGTSPAHEPPTVTVPPADLDSLDFSKSGLEPDPKPEPFVYRKPEPSLIHVLSNFSKITRDIRELAQMLEDGVRDRLSDKDIDDVCNIVDEEIARLELLKTAFRSGATDAELAKWIGE